MARSDPQVNIRMPADLKAQLEIEALRAGRSLTTEMIARLERTLTMAEPDMGEHDLGKAISWLMKISDRAGMEVNVVIRRKGAPKLVDEKYAADLSDRVPD